MWWARDDPLNAVLGHYPQARYRKRNNVYCTGMTIELSAKRLFSVIQSASKSSRIYKRGTTLWILLSTESWGLEWNRHRLSAGAGDPNSLLVKQGYQIFTVEELVICMDGNVGNSNPSLPVIPCKEDGLTLLLAIDHGKQTEEYYGDDPELSELRDILIRSNEYRMEHQLRMAGSLFRDIDLLNSGLYELIHRPYFFSGFRKCETGLHGKIMIGNRGDTIPYISVFVDFFDVYGFTLSETFSYLKLAVLHAYETLSTQVPGEQDS